MKVQLTFEIIDDNRDSLYANQWEKEIDDDAWLDLLSDAIYEDIARIYDESSELLVGWRDPGPAGGSDIRVGRSMVNEFSANRIKALHTLLKKKCSKLDGGN